MEQSVRLLLFGGLADTVDATKLLLLLFLLGLVHQATLLFHIPSLRTLMLLSELFSRDPYDLQACIATIFAPSKVCPQPSHTFLLMRFQHTKKLWA